VTAGSAAAEGGAAGLLLEGLWQCITANQRPCSQPKPQDQTNCWDDDDQPNC